MSDFRVSELSNSSVLYIYSLRDVIEIDPDYQRLGDIWPLEKKQLLLDSIINGYDIPKLYFHEFYPARNMDGKKISYAIIDGKQRLESIWQFIAGQIALGDDCEYLADPQIPLAGLTYKELADKYPDIKVRFDSTRLSIITVQTDELDLIEDMFSRLNEAVPLSAAEKRNAFGGPIPRAIRSLCRGRFFKQKLPFSNKRYRHFDLAAKFLYVTTRSAIVDTKKVYLDEFVRTFPKDDRQAKRLEGQAAKILDKMASAFVDEDCLLRSVGMTTIYYLLFVEAFEDGWVNDINRKTLVDFEERRQKNRVKAAKDVAKASYDLLEFDRLTQTPNDGVALEFRYKVLRKHIGPQPVRLLRVT